MAFGKSNDTKRRHRPKKVVEIDEEEIKEKRQDQLNTQKIPMIVSIVGCIAMFGIVVMGAPYSYGSKRVHYSGDHLRISRSLLEGTKKERAEADPKVLIDFTNIITPQTKAPTAAMQVVAAKCRQGRPSSFNQVIPEEIHRAFDKSTKFLTCAMATELKRLCFAEERQFLVGQLLDYKEKRQNVLAFEKYRDKTVTSYNAYRETQRAAGLEAPRPLEITDAKMDPNFDAGLLQRIEFLVKNGYFSAKDFGYRGFYVPEEYADVLRVGADRYAPCERWT
jgi:hypothetical protein